MWWDVAPAHRAEFEDWHSHEHFAERLAIPGFLRASRWGSAAGGDGFFVMYELDAIETLTSQPYVARLDDPTPWSVRMMPLHRNMVRSLCAVELTCGGGVAKTLLTVRLAPRAGEELALLDRLRDVLRKLPLLPGIVAAHLLRTQPSMPRTAPTTEQKIRGGDATADWILLVAGYDSAALVELASAQFAAKELAALGAEPEPISDIYDLRYARTPADS